MGQSIVLNRRTLFSVVAIAFMATPIVKGQDMPNSRLVDLTHPFDAQTIYWPTEDGFKLIPEAGGVTEQGYYYAANRFMCAEHGGTHIDAPRHFAENGQTVDQLPLERLVGPAVCVDVVQEVRRRSRLPGDRRRLRRPGSCSTACRSTTRSC